MNEASPPITAYSHRISGSPITPQKQVPVVTPAVASIPAPDKTPRTLRAARMQGVLWLLVRYPGNPKTNIMASPLSSAAICDGKGEATSGQQRPPCQAGSTERSTKSKDLNYMQGLDFAPAALHRQTAPPLCQCLIPECPEASQARRHRCTFSRAPGSMSIGGSQQASGVGDGLHTGQRIKSYSWRVETLKQQKLS